MQPNETPNPLPPPIEAAEDALHGASDVGSFKYMEAFAIAHGLSLGSAMLLTLDSVCAHLAAGAPARRRLLADLLRVAARRAGMSATAPLDAERRTAIDHAKANGALLNAIEIDLAGANPPPPAPAAQNASV